MFLLIMFSGWKIILKILIRLCIHKIDKRTFRQQKCYRKQEYKTINTSRFINSNVIFQDQTRLKVEYRPVIWNLLRKSDAVAVCKDQKYSSIGKSFTKHKNLKKGDVFPLWTFIWSWYSIKYSWLDLSDSACVKHLWWSKKWCEILYISFLDLDLDSMVPGLKFYRDVVMIQ